MSKHVCLKLHVTSLHCLNSLNNSSDLSENCFTFLDITDQSIKWILLIFPQPKTNFCRLWLHLVLHYQLAFIPCFCGLLSTDAFSAFAVAQHLPNVIFILIFKEYAAI